MTNESIGEVHSEIHHEDDDASCPSLDELKHHREHRDKKYESTIQIGWLGNKQGPKITGPDYSKRIDLTSSSSNGRILNTCGMETTTEHSIRGCLPQVNDAEEVPFSESNPARQKKQILNVRGDGNDNVEKNRPCVNRQQLVVVDDSSFLASANIEDASISKIQSKESSNREQYVFGFTLLTTKNGETIEELPADDSSFIVDAAVVEDVVVTLNNNDNESIGQCCNDISSQYDVHASTLSRATASTRASIIKKKSNNNSDTHNNKMIAEVGDEKSTSTYSYGQAYYGDNTTLTSKFTSTFSALTDDTNLHQVTKRTGMLSSPVNFRTTIEERDGSTHYLPSKLGPSFDSGDVTAPCRGGANKKSISNNMACYVSDETSDFTTSNETPSQQVSGYIDEEAARDWHTLSSSSRSCKLAVMFSILFLLLCGAGVAIALLLFREKDISTINESASSLYDECATGIPCYEETLGCNDGTIESCCGETFYSYVCDCMNFNSNLLYANCRYTEVCTDPSCEGM